MARPPGRFGTVRVQCRGRGEGGGSRGARRKGRAGDGERVLTPAWHGIEEWEERGGGERGGAHIGA